MKEDKDTFLEAVLIALVIAFILNAAGVVTIGLFNKDVNSLDAHQAF